MYSAKQRILCVEDDVDTFALIATVLSSYEVVGASNLYDGLVRTISEHFDLYLLDDYLLDGTGLELCRLIRLFDQDTPILLIAATRSLTEREALTAGAQGVIEQGLDFVAKLEEAVSRLLPSKT